MAKSSEKKLIVTILVPTLIVLVAVGALGYFSYSRYSEYKENLVKFQQAPARKTTLLDQKETLQQQKTEAEKWVDKAVEILPDATSASGENLNRLMDSFREGAQLTYETPLLLTAFSVNKDRSLQMTNIKRHAYDVQLFGNFVQILRFIYLIENHEWFMSVDAIDIRMSEIDKKNAPFIDALTPKEAKLIISTYTYTAPTASAEAAKPGGPVAAR